MTIRTSSVQQIFRIVRKRIPVTTDAERLLAFTTPVESSRTGTIVPGVTTAVGGGFAGR